jgi:Domain of unknown function (DUF4157)
MRARTHTRAAAPLQAVPEVGVPAPAGVAAEVARAQGGGEPLAPSVRREMESALRADFGAVRVHADGQADRLNRKVDAAAFTVGHDVFFRAGTYAPESSAGRQLLAHELTHVVQQRAAHASTGLDLPGAPHASLAPDGPAEAQGVLQRVPFKGPQFKGGPGVATAFVKHDMVLAVGNPTTLCGVQNQITTDGSKLNKGQSKPGQPKKMGVYRGGFSQPGGLVRDKSQPQAATRMHLINHRLENSKRTQRNPQNIFLGTQKSNNPTHLNEVEQPVIDAVTQHGSQSNLLYQAEMAAAVPTKDGVGDVLFWPAAAKPNNLAVKHVELKPVWLVKNDPARGVAPKKKFAFDAQGYALEIEAITPANNYQHLWLEYEVTANYAAAYAGIPAYVQGNVAIETAANAGNVGAKKAQITQKIKDFKNGWAAEAFPVDFDCEVHYYSASYDPPGIYFKETEKHSIDADL